MSNGNTLQDAFGMCCPACGNDQLLQVTITCTALLSINGTEDLGDHDWDAGSDCECPDCGHAAKVADFAAKEVRS